MVEVKRKTRQFKQLSPPYIAVVAVNPGQVNFLQLHLCDNALRFLQNFTEDTSEDFDLSLDALKNPLSTSQFQEALVLWYSS